MSFHLYLPLAAGVAGYVLGSISFAVLVARRHGVDILKAGSCNPGATNVKRVCGRGAGNLVFALDVFKGAVAAGWPALVPLFAGEVQGQVLYAQLAGFAGAVIGHCFSIFLRFKGGKGVAVSVGGLGGAMPLCLVVAGSLWLVVYFSTRYVSVGSVLGGLSLPVTAALLWGTADARFWLCLGIALTLVFTHRGNLLRLIRGEEHRFKSKKDS
ncbi:MAG: glycerol-3-phosphate 1-O-acyltransferase PlsY [Puniceicoccales bacterium]|jgi:glycerol-3-phosphate acyltransferase PlsY|nr:glycerol-3-phosphate 1-O-acyltransferase PlsY [Puniceicoccales bacterium]